MPTRTSKKDHETFGYRSDGNVHWFNSCGAEGAMVVACAECETCVDASGTANCELTADTCLIDGVCFNQGDLPPQNECLFCDSSENTAQWSPHSNTTSCDDGLSCTYDDACNGAGECIGKDRICVDDAATCGANRSCNGTSTCTEQFPGNEIACSDGNGCTQNDRCNGLGLCIGSEVACSGNVMDGCCPSACDKTNDQDCCNDFGRLDGDGCCPDGEFIDDQDCECNNPSVDVRQPGSSLCWRRCPLGLSGDNCDIGDVDSLNSSAAADACAANEYYVPSLAEFDALLGSSGGCDEGDLCEEMFGTDIGSYITSSHESGIPNEIIYIHFQNGTTHSDGAMTSSGHVRCARFGP